ncbi:flagellin N-terminal helical domain-containing protein [Pengzhenrongella sicca]|uniref:Flagellin n=1 Tax=Pengzhenrongella sicca TaxID=2819238 RepID=A0A8A4ZFY1_9MICO|nr:flagellin [Pengzhenrongella sicca]QTE29853.1 flagellin [Pengzhenrongella sicca]
MALSINTNMAALNAYRNLNTTQNDLSKSLEKLSSGFRINRAADDAAGLAISEGMRSQMGGITMGVRNAQDGISLVQTAEGALNETTSILQRMRDLTVQGANTGSLTDEASANIQVELTDLTKEIDSIAMKTKFNGQSLLGGGAAGAAGTAYTGSFQVGANAGDTVSVTIASAKVSDLGLQSVATTVGSGVGGGLVSLAASANATSTDIAQNLTNIDAAISEVSTSRAALGAQQNTFDHTINNANVALENVTASESRIRDTDMASEMVKFTRAQILSQAGTAMLAQAKSIPQGVLQLLQ